ncbi:hypothetical protein D3H65_05330 [Paraflavitalea soli]|uniref:Uncharacterized protein n=1 Tax=Paraflavitalea soli TaxID=2315862 RepID=A0A3B7MJF8_9BACT|nr:hypothetical protein [Paraflavitalea soli]AXY73433.1 hypothetical protein D3H65_05330 [Paraflavitalea soli]
MPKKRKFNSTIPPCPDPDKYVLVRGKYRYFWRRNRGTVKPAVLNEVLARSAAITVQTNNAAKQMMALLSVFTQKMDLGMTTTRVAGAFKKAYLESGKMDFRHMDKVVFQEDYPIYKLFTGHIHQQMVRGSLQLSVGVGSLNVHRPSTKAESYQLHAILLSGDPSKARGIRIETDESRTYSYKEQGQIECKLSLVLPAKNRPWMVLLYLGTKLNVPLNAGPRYQAMMVVRTG